MIGKSGAAWLMAIVAAVAVLVCLYQYLVLGSGVDHTAGALLVLISTAALVVLALILTRVLRGGGSLTVLILCLLDILGSGLAGWFLHAWLLLALLAVCLIAWLARAFLPGRRGLEPSPARGV